MLDWIDNATFVGDKQSVVWNGVLCMKKPCRFRDAKRRSEDLRRRSAQLPASDSPATNAQTASDTGDRHTLAGSELYHSLFESIHDVYFRTDLNGTICVISPSALFQTGYDPSELVGKHVSSIGLTTNGRCFLDHLREVSCLIDSEVELLTRTGSRRYFSANARLVFGDDRIPIAAEAILRDITERKLNEQRLIHMSYHDLLTGLPNRLLFRDRVNQAVAHSRRNDKGFAILFLDLDRFKAINDSEGHCTGDLLLKAVADRVHGSLRQVDTMARMGGDEFTVLLPDIQTRLDAEVVANRILEMLAAPFDLGEKELNVSASIGISLYPLHGQDPESLLNCADQAMYRVKRESRNGYSTFAK